MKFTTVLIIAGAIMAIAMPNAAAAPEAEAVAMPIADTDFEFADVEKRQRHDCQWSGCSRHCGPPFLTRRGSRACGTHGQFRDTWCCRN